MSQEQVKALLSSLKDAADDHHCSRRLFWNLAAIAQNSINADEAGRLIAEHVEANDDINEWIELHCQLVEITLAQWHEAARRYAKTRGEKA
jgi:hypothetical protein